MLKVVTVVVIGDRVALSGAAAVVRLWRVRGGGRELRLQGRGDLVAMHILSIHTLQSPERERESIQRYQLMRAEHWDKPLICIHQLITTYAHEYVYKFVSQACAADSWSVKIGGGGGLDHFLWP